MATITYYTLTTSVNDENYGSITKSDQTFQSNTGLIAYATTSNGSTGTGRVDTTNIQYKATTVNYAFALSNPDGFDRQAHYHVSLNGSNVVNWTNYIGSTTNKNGSVNVAVDNFSILQCNAWVTSNGSSGSAYVSAWQEKGKGDYYRSGESVTVTASPNEGFEFDHFLVNNVEIATNPYTFTITENTEVIAYLKVSGYSVNITVNPSDSGSVTGGGSYPDGSSAILTATPNLNYVFDHFEIDDINITENPYTFIVHEDTSVVAYFVSILHDVYLSVDPSDGGTVTGEGTYPEGASVTITAVPSLHKTFIGWKYNGSIISQSLSYTFVMGNSDASYTAKFRDSLIFTVTSSTDPSDLTIIYQSSKEVYEGEQVTLNARPVNGYLFSNWSTGSIDNPYTFVPTSDTNVTAVYKRVPYLGSEVYPYRAFIKDQYNLNGLPKAFLFSDEFTFRTDLMTKANSSFEFTETVPKNISNGDIFVLFTPMGKIWYQGIITGIEDKKISTSQIQSFYKGNWVYDTYNSEPTIEGEFAFLLQSYALGYMKGSSYQDTLIYQEKAPLVINIGSVTLGNLPTQDDKTTMDMEDVIYYMYDKYGIILDFYIPYGEWTIGDQNGGKVVIKIPNYSTLKLGNHMECITNLSPTTDIEETNRLIIYSSEGVYRATYVFTTTEGIVKEPSTNTGRYGVVNTEIVYSDDPETDLVAANLPSTMYNHHLTFDIYLDNNFYSLDDLKLGTPIEIWNKGDYYQTVITGIEISKKKNKNPTVAKVTCGKVRLALTQKLTMGIFK